MLNQITCPHCGKEVEVSEALKHEFEEKLIKELGEKHKKELEEVTRKAENKIENKLKNQFELQIKTAKEDLEETQKRNKELLEQLTELNKLIRDLKKKDDERTYETEKKIIEAEDKAREEAKKKAVEESHLKILEKEKQLSDALKVNEELKRKLQQGSMQTQGEVLELDLEQGLRNAFIHDEINAIEKGEKGGDIFQKIKNSYGQVAGSILWETKRAKWSPSWLPKLREDTRKIGASVSVLVCETLPESIKNFGFIDGVVVTNYSCAIPIAGIIRRGILQVAVAKSAASNKDQKLEDLYRYLQGDNFRHRFESYVEGIISMQQDLETEKRSAQRLWKKREIQIERTLENIANMYGELQGIMGKSLPEIKLLDTSQIPDSETEN